MVSFSTGHHAQNLLPSPLNGFKLNGASCTRISSNTFTISHSKDSECKYANMSELVFIQRYVSLCRTNGVSLHSSPAETHLNLPFITDLMKEYRKADDAITMRLNRSTAQFRDRDRLGLGPKDSSPQDEACLYLWKEIVGW